MRAISLCCSAFCDGLKRQSNIQLRPPDLDEWMAWMVVR